MQKFFTWIDHNFLTIISGFLLVFLPLYPKLPLVDALPGYIVRVRLEDFVIGITIIIWSIYVLRGKIKLTENPLFKPILLYLVFGLITMVSAVFVIHTVPLVPLHIGKMILHYLRRIEYFSLFFVFFSTIRSLKTLKIYIAVFAGTVLVVSLYGFGQKYLYWPAFSTMNREFSKGWVLYLTEHARVLSTFGGHYDLAAYIMMALVMLWSIFFAAKKIIIKIITFVIIAAAFWTLILTASRTSFLAYLFGLTFMFAIWAYRKGIGWTISRWLGVVLLSIIIMLSFGDLSERFTKLLRINERIGGIKSLIMSPIAKPPADNALFLENNPNAALSQITSKSDQPPTPKRPSDVYQDMPLMIPVSTGSATVTAVARTYSQTAFMYDLSTAIRFDALWPMAIKGFNRNPLVGSGYSTLNKVQSTDFSEAESTDNDFLRTLGETGILGFIAFYGTILYITYYLWRNLNLIKDPIFFSMVAGFTGLVFGLLANALYIDVFVSSKVAYTFWGLTGIILGGVSVLKKDNKGVISSPKIPGLKEFFLKILGMIKKFFHSDLFVLLIILLIALFLRLYKIKSPVADWHSWRQADTSAVTRNFVRNGINLLYPTYEDLSNIASGKDNPKGLRFVEFPLYNYFSVIVDKLFVGYTVEISGRLTSIFSALTTIIFLYFLVKRWIGKSEAVISGLLYSILPYNIFYTRVILPEPLLVALTVGAIYLFDTFALRIADRTKQTNQGMSGLIKNSLLLVLSVAFAAFALLVKPTAVFLFPVILYSWFSRLGLRWRSVISILVLLFIASIPLLLWRLWITQFPEGVPAFQWLLNGDGIRLKGAFFYWLFADRIGRMILGYWGTVFLFMGLVVHRQKEKWLFYVWGAGILLYLVVIATGNVRHDYYQIFTIPIIVVFCAKGIVWMFRQGRSVFDWKILYPLSVVAIIFMEMFAWYHIRDLYNINHPEIVEAGQMVELKTPQNSLVIAPYGGDTAFLYQTRRQGWPIIQDSIDKLIEKGADYYVSVNFDDETKKIILEAQTNAQLKGWKIIELNNTFVIVQLIPDNKLPK